VVSIGWVTAAITLAGPDVTSLRTAGYVWLSNYRQLRTSLPLGLVGFAVVLAVPTS
jgi:hypothetical protein